MRFAPCPMRFWLPPAFLPFPSLVSLHGLFGSNTQIEFFHIFIFPEQCGRISHHNSSVLQNKTEMSDLQGHSCILLHQKDSDPFLIEELDDPEDLLNQDG